MRFRERYFLFDKKTFTIAVLYLPGDREYFSSVKLLPGNAIQPSHDPTAEEPDLFFFHSQCLMTVTRYWFWRGSALPPRRLRGQRSRLAKKHNVTVRNQCWMCLCQYCFRKQLKCHHQGQLQLNFFSRFYMASDFTCLLVFLYFKKAVGGARLENPVKSLVNVCKAREQEINSIEEKFQ